MIWTIAGWTAVAALGTFAVATPFLIRWLNRGEAIEALVSSVTCQRCRTGGMGSCTCTDPRKCGHPACGQPGPCERCFYNDADGDCSCTCRCAVSGCEGLKPSLTRWTEHDVPILSGNLDSLRETWWLE